MAIRVHILLPHAKYLVKESGEWKLPSSLANVIKRIESLFNEENRQLIYAFVDFMKSIDISEKYQKDNLFVVILFATYIGSKQLSDVNRRQDIIEFLDTRKKDVTIDPEQKWIRTWNDYLQRIKYFMRWLHNYHNNNTNKIDNNVDSMQTYDWETPSFMQIKKKKTNRISPYLESELWERDELLTTIKYESRKRNKAALSLLWDLNARNHEVTLLKVMQ